MRGGAAAGEDGLPGKSRIEEDTQEVLREERHEEGGGGQGMGEHEG